MPVRFACPHCHQKLSVSSRKAGREANCPRCQRLLTIPAANSDAVEIASPKPTHEDGAVHSVNAVASAEVSSEEKTDAHRAHDAVAPDAAGHDEHGPIDYGHHEEFELVFDTSDDDSETGAVHTSPDLIAVPRLVLYLQGGLLAVVALVSFAIGLIAGGAFSAGAPASGPRACTLEGTINYASGNRNLPDPGAVVAIIPEEGLKPQSKAPIDGLRPGDTLPDESHRGVAILRELGGAYARADDRGRFQVRVPDRGKYLVLVISSARQLASLDDISTADLLKLGPFFDNAPELLGRHQYRLTSELVRNDRQLNVVFE